MGSTFLSTFKSAVNAYNSENFYAYKNNYDQSCCDQSFKVDLSRPWFMGHTLCNQ